MKFILLFFCISCGKWNNNILRHDELTQHCKNLIFDVNVGVESKITPPRNLNDLFELKSLNDIM